MFLSDQERQETIKACRFCMMCHVADRVPRFLRRESYTPRGRGAILAALEQGLLEWDSTVADIMYSSLNDGLLQEWCVGNYDHEELVIDARARLFEKGLAPPEVVVYLDRLRQEPHGCKSPQQILADGGVKVTPGAETLIFAGCSLKEESSASLLLLGKMYNLSGEPFQVLADEPCCGWPFYQLGDWQGARQFSQTVGKALKSSGAAKVVLLDADCLRMLNTRTARFGGDVKGLRFRHALEVLAAWLDEGSLTVKQPLQESVTYHDPCALARYCPDLESPRKIISALTGGPPLEMALSAKLSPCCGAGGMLAVYRHELSSRIASLRLAEAQETGARVMATGCSRCQVTFEEALPESSANGLRVFNLVDLVARAVGVASNT